MAETAARLRGSTESFTGPPTLPSSSSDSLVAFLFFPRLLNQRYATFLGFRALESTFLGRELSKRTAFKL